MLNNDGLPRLFASDELVQRNDCGESRRQLQLVRCIDDLAFGQLRHLCDHLVA